jgi:hypothetical protein
MNAKHFAALCVGVASTVGLVYAASTKSQTAAETVAASSVAAVVPTTQNVTVSQTEYCFSEAVEFVSCEDQLIMSAATGHPASTQ